MKDLYILWNSNNNLRDYSAAEVEVTELKETER